VIDSQMMQKAQIVLASASPRRRELLAQINICSWPYPVDIDESVIKGETASLYVQRLALRKAQQARDEVQQDSTLTDIHSLAVLGSDTAIEINGEILGKPSDSAHACQILAKLSDNKHIVHTAVALVTSDKTLTSLSRSEVTFAKLSMQRIEQYVATNEPMGKAGAYGIQGQGAQFVKVLNGSYSGVMGLPLYETSELLLKININPLLPNK